MDFKLGALLIISAQICATLALRPCVCTRNLSPVCGSDGNTYSNQCMLECSAHTSGNSISVAKQGPCQEPAPEDQICICTYEYKPVCGTDGQTYSNECAMGCQKRKYNPSLGVKYAGACVAPVEPQCVCPFLYSPVCGSDGKTYSNDCALNCATKDNSMLSIAHRGGCVDNVRVVDAVRVVDN